MSMLNWKDLNQLVMNWMLENNKLLIMRRAYKRHPENVRTKVNLKSHLLRLCCTNDDIVSFFWMSLNAILKVCYFLAFNSWEIEYSVSIEHNKMFPMILLVRLSSIVCCYCYCLYGISWLLFGFQSVYVTNSSPIYRNADWFPLCTCKLAEYRFENEVENDFIIHVFNECWISLTIVMSHLYFT